MSYKSITMRQRRNLSKYNDSELISVIEEAQNRWTLLEEEKHLRESGSRPYDTNGRVRK